MNVAQGTRNSVNLSPHSQPKFDQPRPDSKAVKSSSQWSTSQPTRKLLPRHPREYERQELLQAAESGRLAFRRIELTEERNYFSGMGAPRPFTLVLPGGMAPTGRVPETYGKWMVGIFDPQCLYVYKRNAGTRSLAMMLPELTPENRLVKLLPDLQSVLDRYFERGNQLIWKVYPARFTSGHLNADGTFCLPELKPGYHSTDDDFPELVLTHYKKQDVKCFCVYNDAEINVSDILRDKRQCEKVLRLKPLPLVVYCNRTGSVEVYYDDELDSQYLSMNEHSLNDFAFSQGVAPDHFRAMLNLLPMSVRAEALSSERTTTEDPDVRHKLQQAIDLVSEPGSYHCERLLDLKQRGLPIHQRFFHERGVDSLLEILLCSAMIRNDQPEHEQTREQEEETCRLCWLLLKSGAQLARDFPPLVMMCNTLNPVMPPGIMNYLVAAFAPFDVLTLKHLRRIPLTDCPGSVVEFDRICRECTPQKLQSCLEELLRYPCSFNSPTLDIIQSKLLALYHYGASLDKNVLNRFEADVKHQYPNGKKIINNFSLNDYIRWLNQLYEQRETHPFYQNWPKYVRQAHQDIADLRRSLGLDDSQNLETPSSAEAPAALQFMVDTFSKPPAMPENVGDNEKTILKVLQHYYRRPGPERVIQCLGKKTLPTVWKPLHSCSHVLRARNNGLWYMELLEKFQQCSLSPEEKELLALAIIYHDAAAEDVDKSAEETRSAHYFKRDLKGRYPEPLLDDVALAMVSKENDVNGEDEQSLPEPVRGYLRILRFADRLDIIRVFGVGADFPGLTVARPLGFDASRLDLPLHLTREFTSGSDNKTEFQRHLEAAMHGAADLARLTGQLQDQRKKNYTEVYGLSGNGEKISENFEWTTEPVQRMKQFIDDNVRRKMAQQAGMVVCSDPSHKACKADQKKGITRGIHNSWFDLRQVELPAGMTLLEKMQYEHDPSLLSPATQQALEKEVQRLKSDGIQMNLGTLTQATLASEEAQKMLNQRGITVVSENRPFVTNNGEPKEWKMLVPKKIAQLDDQNAPAEESR